MDFQVDLLPIVPPAKLVRVPLPVCEAYRNLTAMSASPPEPAADTPAHCEDGRDCSVCAGARPGADHNGRGV